MGFLLGNRLKNLFKRYATGGYGNHMALTSAQGHGLHEGMLHLEIMHEKSHKEHKEFLNSIYVSGRGN